jgi:hypothetical protein
MKKTHSVLNTMGLYLLSSKAWDLYNRQALYTCFPRKDICLLGKKIKSPLPPNHSKLLVVEVGGLTL